MLRNYTPGQKLVSMSANEIKRNEHKSIHEQINDFFGNGGAIKEVPPGCSALDEKPSRDFVISAKKNAERLALNAPDLQLESESCN